MLMAVQLAIGAMVGFVLWPKCRSGVCLPLPADIDATGIHWLDDLVDELREDSIQLVLGNPAKMVRLLCGLWLGWA